SCPHPCSRGFLAPEIGFASYNRLRRIESSFRFGVLLNAAGRCEAPLAGKKKPTEVAIVWKTRARFVLSMVLLTVAATLGSVGTAQAALYTGKWDPAYGAIFPNLGWEASAVFDVPAPCLAL